MITFAEAQEKLLDQVKPLDKISVQLDKMAGHYLAEPLVTPIDLPLFDNSAVDGFGVHISEIANASPQTPVRLNFAGLIAAGNSGDVKLERGSTVKILTGAPVPANVEAVVMREYCEELNGEVFFHTTASAGENIRRRGDEFLRGQEVMAEGSLITPAVVGLLATLGYLSCRVYRKPEVIVVSTGNELVKPGSALMPGKIYESNSYALAAAMKAFAIEKCQSVHAADDLDHTKHVLSSAAKTADIIISTGGVSVGDFDYVKDAAEALGFSTVLWKIAMKPGKPVYFGILEHKADDKKPARTTYLFGLPGNPVSSLVTLHQLVKPVLLKMLGAQSLTPPVFKATLLKTIKKKSGRLEFLRGLVNPGEDGLEVTPTIGQDSHMLSGLAKANCLIHFPLEAETIEAGNHVSINLLNWCPGN